jgi:phospholipid-binding lipoprotein MlaA
VLFSNRGIAVYGSTPLARINLGDNVIATRLTVCSCLTILLLASGCASQPAAPKEDRSEADPWEPMNRQIHGFNTGLDKVTLKPLAKGYQFVFPQFLRTGIRNFSSNLRTPLNAMNIFLQGKGKTGFSETGRFLANSTIGLAGIFDVATEMGLEKHNEDFGQTFSKCGIPDGPYVTIPILGPRTLRDAFAIPLNLLADPLFWYDNSSVRDKLYILRLIDVREKLFAAESLLEGSPDRYIATREAYLQNRLYLIYDGDPPEDDDFFEEFMEDEE